MTEPDLVGLFVRPLERLQIRYMITGGVASVIYGDPRFTRDLDLVVELGLGAIRPFADAFGTTHYYVPPEEALVAEASRSEAGHFKVIHRESVLRADIYLAKADPFHRWALERRRRIELESLSTWVAPVEYVVVRKLEYFRWSGSERHLRDVAMMLRISADLVDPDVLREWSQRQGVEGLLEEGRDFRQ